MRFATLLSLMLLAIAAAPALSQPPPRFQVPHGFVVEQVAAPPLVRYPLFACFDHQGRLYVAEGTGLNVAGKDIVEKKLGRIVVLEDKDGDGKFDTSKVFADGLVFPQGVLWHDGSVYCASHPSFWKLTDTDGDGVADKREELVTGFNFNGNGCDIHGPFLGPDGRLYWTDGRHGYKIKTRDGKQFEGLAARIWRCKTDGTDLERIAGGGFDNPVELAWTEDGEMIGTMDQGPGDCLLHYVEGGVYPMEHPCIKEFTWTGPLLGAVQKYSVALPAALCGTMRYRSDAFGPKYRNLLFTTHYMTHKIVTSKLIRDGSTFRAEDEDFLVSSDPNLRLTDVLEDADGSVIFVDMGAWFTYGFLGNPIPRPDSKGGIYRIRRVDAPKVNDPWGKALHLDKRQAELTRFLDDPRPQVRDQVVARLAILGTEDALSGLGNVIGSGQCSPMARRNAVWSLCRIGTREALIKSRSALRDEDVSVRMAAIHTAGLHRDAFIGTFMDLIGVLTTSDEPPIRRKAIESLGRIGRENTPPVLLDEFRRPQDAFLEHAAIYALIQSKHRGHLADGLTHTDAAVQRAALIALDQVPDGKLTQAQVIPLLESSDARLQQTAMQVVSRRPEWAAAAQGVVRKWLQSPQLTPAQENTLNEVLLAGSGDPAIQKLVADGLTRNRRGPAWMRPFLVKVIGQSRVEPLPRDWVSAMEAALFDEAARREALATIKARNWTEFDQRLRALSRQTEQPIDVRLAALECFAARRAQLDPASFAFLVDQLKDDTEPLHRLSAARTVAASSLSAEQLTQLAQVRGLTTAMILRLILPAFGKSSDTPAGAALVEALHRSPAAESLTLAELDQALKNYSNAVRAQAEPLREKLIVRQKGQAAYLAGLSTELDKLSGDADAGKEIFLAPKNNCFACHRAVGRGGTIGPDLSHIGKFRTKAELLESIIFPSLTIAPEYRSHQVTTKAGKSVTGLVIRDAADALVLRLTDLFEVRLARKDIDDIAPATVSLMPDGLERTLSRQELRDLLEFLVSQR